MFLLTGFVRRELRTVQDSPDSSGAIDGFLVFGHRGQAWAMALERYRHQPLSNCWIAS